MKKGWIQDLYDSAERIEECSNCGEWYSPAKKTCPHCGMANLDYFTTKDWTLWEEDMHNVD